VSSISSSASSVSSSSASSKYGLVPIYTFEDEYIQRYFEDEYIQRYYEYDGGKMPRSKFTKQPYEEFAIGADFSKNYVTGETVDLSNSTVLAYELPSGSLVTPQTDVLVGNPYRTTNPDVSTAKTNAMLAIRVKAGAHGDDLKITFRSWSSNGQKFEKDIFIDVREI
jgi:hypothetical protein